MENLNQRLEEINYSDLTGDNFQKYDRLIKDLAPEGDGKFKPQSPTLEFDEFKAKAVFSQKDNKVIGVEIIDPVPTRTVKIPAYDAKIMNSQIANSRITPTSFYLLKK